MVPTTSTPAAPLESLLRRFQATSDPEALGALFDATAPALFKVALASSPDPASAEDALQEMYLAVIDAAASYDGSRPAWPWLMGIASVQSLDAGVLEDVRLWDLDVDAEVLLQEVFREFHERQSPEQRSVLRAAELLASHPGADRVERLVRRVVRLHDENLDREDFEAAVVIRGVLVQLAEDRREPLKEWVKNARFVLQEQVDVRSPFDEEE